MLLIIVTELFINDGETCLSALFLYCKFASRGVL